MYCKKNNLSETAFALKTKDGYDLKWFTPKAELDKPRFSKLKSLSQGLGVVITSVGKSEDFASRYFFPKLGVNEDPVIGSAHSSLIPFWSTRLSKTNMIAKQLSKREGILNCEFANDRVNISGRAALYLKGKIYF